MQLNERQFSDYVGAYARRIFKHSDGSSGDQRTYDRAVKHLSSKFQEKSKQEIHAELSKHYKFESVSDTEHEDDTICDEEEMRERLIRWHRLHVIGESIGAKMINPPKKSKDSLHDTVDHILGNDGVIMRNTTKAQKVPKK